MVRPGFNLILLGFGLVGTLMLITACAPPPVETPPPDDTYQMRGKVIALPNARHKEISIYHEAVPNFAGSDDEIVGMDAMTMPFTLAADLSLDGIEKGDKVSFELEVRWEGPDVITISKIDKLPADTVLDFDR